MDNESDFNAGSFLGIGFILLFFWVILYFATDLSLSIIFAISYAITIAFMTLAEKVNGFALSLVVGGIYAIVFFGILWLFGDGSLVEQPNANQHIEIIQKTKQLNLENVEAERDSFEFYLLLIIAIVIRFIPFIKIPFRMLSVYIHELGHGLTAIFTGGGVDKIILNLDGSGLCLFSYRNVFFRFLIALAGYIATSVVGFYIYYTAKTNPELINLENIYILLGAIAVSITLWVRDQKTFFLSLTILVLFGLPVLGQYIEQVTTISQYINIYMKLIGISIMVDGFISPLHLIDGTDDGDGGDLASVTGMPEGFWITVWLCIAAYALYQAYLLG